MLKSEIRKLSGFSIISFLRSSRIEDLKNSFEIFFSEENKYVTLRIGDLTILIEREKNQLFKKISNEFLSGLLFEMI